uniref:Uncharacterized protein n=1 Tax=Parascaris univalens TaxID=6257 RepID=A0A915BAN7_PARUN
ACVDTFNAAHFQRHPTTCFHCLSFPIGCRDFWSSTFCRAAITVSAAI